ncbi:uncharacterized protein LOC127877368 [Dreissena polymorpha]|uniref:Uncharacterized protein n=1 Tax=Dreissena polymorpha TaxID=45954 RepID=A0A9D4MPS0_DREPO|nr:uncharacterized protein LOC127877368 [Dreissena polymorpha]KAH3880253.1 hypothetical protein DPMN_004163 [Dreissena polymorpha]
MVSKSTLTLAVAVIVLYVYTTNAQPNPTSNVTADNTQPDQTGNGVGGDGGSPQEPRRRVVRRRRIKPQNNNGSSNTVPQETPVADETQAPPPADETPAPTVTRSDTVAPPVTRANELGPPVTRAEASAPPAARADAVSPPAARADAVAPPAARADTVAPPATRADAVSPPAARVDAVAPPVARADAVAPTRREPVRNVVSNAPSLTAASNAPVRTAVANGVPARNAVANANSVGGSGASAGAGGMSDAFFGSFFDDETTPISPAANEPPPTFDPNKKPGEKVMPKVDKSKAKDHEGLPCNETFREHDTIPSKYMMKYSEGFWDALDCPPTLGGSNLIWRQDLCSCGEELRAHDPNDWCAQMGYNPFPESPHKYIRRHFGTDAVMDCAASLVWSQEKCLCIFDPNVNERPIEQKVRFVCKKILHLEFEDNLTNSVQGYHVQPVELERRGTMPRIRYRKVPGSQEKAAMIVSQPLEFLSFRGNDFQLHVTYAISFKLSPHHVTKDNFMVLLSDECVGTQGARSRERKPSIVLAFQPSTQTFNLQFRTEQTDIDTNITGAVPDKDGWYKNVVYFEDQSVNLESNGKLLFKQPEVLGKIPQNRCPLFIGGRGQGFDRSQDFYGYLDNVYLVKDCKFHEANIKFL